MSPLPVATYLEEFDFECRGGGHRPSAASRTHEAPQSAARGEDDRDADCEAAFADGFEKGRIEATAELEAKLEEQRAAFASRAAAERQAWIVQTAGGIADQLAAGLRELEASVADTTARILEPFLKAELRRQAIVDLRSHLDVLLTRDPGIALSMSGPEELLQALRRLMPENVGQLTLVPSTDLDVRIGVGRTILETRLRLWFTKIEEAMR